MINLPSNQTPIPKKALLPSLSSFIQDIIAIRMQTNIAGLQSLKQDLWVNQRNFTAFCRFYNVEHSFQSRLYFRLNIFVYMCVCVCCTCKQVCWCPQRPEELDPLKLEIRVVVSSQCMLVNQSWVLCTVCSSHFISLRFYFYTGGIWGPERMKI